MNREQLIRALRRYAHDHNQQFEVSTKRGKGSHYRVRVGSKVTTIQKDLTPLRIRRILKQLEIDLDAL